MKLLLECEVLKPHKPCSRVGAAYINTNQLVSKHLKKYNKNDAKKKSEMIETKTFEQKQPNMNEHGHNTTTVKINCPLTFAENKFTENHDIAKIQKPRHVNEWPEVNHNKTGNKFFKK